MQKPPKITWRDIVFAEIDGIYVIPLAIAFSLATLCVGFGVDRLLTLWRWQ